MKRPAKAPGADAAGPAPTPLWTRSAIGVAIVVGWVTGLGAIAGWLPLPGVGPDDAMARLIPSSLDPMLSTGWLAWAAQVLAAAVVAGATGWVTLQLRAPDESRDAAWLASLGLGMLCWAGHPSVAIAVALTALAMVAATRGRGTAALAALAGALVLHPVGWPAAVGVGVLVGGRRAWRHEVPLFFALAAIAVLGVLAWQLWGSLADGFVAGLTHAPRATLGRAATELQAVLATPSTALRWLGAAAGFAVAVWVAPDRGWRALAIATLLSVLLVAPSHAWECLALLTPLLAAAAAQLQQRVLGGNPVALVLAAIVWTVVVLQI